MEKLIGIAVKHEKRAPMQTLDAAFISFDKGVESDFRGKPSKRQVTVISKKAWQEANAQLKIDLPWTTRRANLLLDGLDLENTSGRTITIGDVQLLITQETDPCHRMEEAAEGLLDALKPKWRGGVCCRVISEGKVEIGDDVILSENKTTETDKQNDKAVSATKNWLEHFVIAHNFCPFAAKPFNEDRIRYVSCSATDEDKLVNALVDEILFLKEAKQQETETTILIVPLMLADFLEYNQFLDVVDSIIHELKVEGVIQVASFHPDYQFADLDKDDVRNYTNRSPYPMFHLIRESSIEKAREQMDTESIPDRNMDLLLDLGIEKVKKNWE